MKTYTEKQIEEKVKEIIIDKLVLDEKMLDGNPSFSDLGADSLDTVEIIMEFEKEFQIAIDDETAEKIETVDSAMSYVKNILLLKV